MSTPLRIALGIAAIVCGCKSADSTESGATEAADPDRQEPAAFGAGDAGGAEEEAREPAAAHAAAGGEEAGIALRRLAEGEVAEALEYSGELVGAFGWRDGNGANRVLFSIREGAARDELTGDEGNTRSLFASHYAGVESEEPKRLRLVKDRVGACPFDLTGHFVSIPEELALTDLDGDGIGEITFAYRLACRSDVSPSTLKLLVLEGGDKYILRGTSRIEAGPDAMGGDFRPGDAMRAAPRAFRDHAERVWERIAEDEFESRPLGP